VERWRENVRALANCPVPAALAAALAALP
jgi:hypothetical protein